MRRVRDQENVEYEPPDEAGGRPRRTLAAAKSLFDERDRTRAIRVPKPLGARAFEVVGIPLKQPGFYVVELASPKLGAALLAGAKPAAEAQAAGLSRVHRGAGHQPGGAFQAGARVVAGVGHGAGNRQRRCQTPRCPYRTATAKSTGRA